MGFSVPGSSLGASVTESELSLSDNTTADVSTTAHGFAPKAPNDTSKFLRGDATWGTPAGSGDVTKVGTPANNQVGVWTGDGTLEGDAALTFDTATDVLSVGGTIELGHASDTTLSRVSAGVIAVEGVNVLLNGGALGTPSSGTATNLTGTASGLTAGAVTGFTPASGSLTLSGDDALTLTTSAATNVTLPTTGTLATLAGTEELDNKTLDASVAKGTWTASSWVTPAYTAGGTITLAENSSIALDPAGSADGKYTGITIAGTAGAALAFGDLIYLDPTDSRWELVDANAAAGADGDARGLVGICVLAATGDADPTVILLQGTVRADTAFPSLTIGAQVFASETAGDVTSTRPTTSGVVVRSLGYALTADEMYVSPSADFATVV